MKVLIRGNVDGDREVDIQTFEGFLRLISRLEERAGTFSHLEISTTTHPPDGPCVVLEEVSGNFSSEADA